MTQSLRRARTRLLCQLHASPLIPIHASQTSTDARARACASEACTRRRSAAADLSVSRAATSASSSSVLLKLLRRRSPAFTDLRGELVERMELPRSSESFRRDVALDKLDGHPLTSDSDTSGALIYLDSSWPGPCSAAAASLASSGSNDARRERGSGSACAPRRRASSLLRSKTRPVASRVVLKLASFNERTPGSPMKLIAVANDPAITQACVHMLGSPGVHMFCSPGVGGEGASRPPTLPCRAFGHPAAASKKKSPFSKVATDSESRHQRSRSSFPFF